LSQFGVTARRLSLIALAVVLLALTAAPAHAAFPGENGRIVFFRGGAAWVMNPDGSDQHSLGTRILWWDAGGPAWSPDGTKIAFVDLDRNDDHRVLVMNADGTGRRDVGYGMHPAWSPDGQKLVVSWSGIEIISVDGTTRQQVAGWGNYPSWSPDGRTIAYDCGLGPSDLCLVDADGSNDRLLATGATEADWSPDGSRIVHMRWSSTTENYEIWVMNRDGTNATRLTTSEDVFHSSPAWSPDGRKIVFWKWDWPSGAIPDRIFVMNADGSEQTQIAEGSIPDWQPILRGYPRPAAGALLRVPLAIAYEPCGDNETPNRDHGPALSARSCSPPVPESDYLTVGTQDANAKAAQSAGKVKYVVCITGTTASGECSTPAGMSSPDVRVEAALSDVRQRGDLSDYAGELEVTQTLRITDKQNSPAPPSGTSGTVSDLPVSYTVPCTPTPAPPDLGSSCGVLTRMNALFPGSVLAGKRSNWEIAQVEVLDGGADGLATTSPNTVFAREGIFIP
jgi:Tol biopolymer transport system component